MAAGVRIRPFRDADCPGLADLWVGAWRDVVPDIDFDARRPWFLERIAGLVRGGAHVEVAEDGAGRLIGVVTVDPRDGHLDQLAVARGAWGSGVAAALIARARALSPAGLDLEVNTINVRAIRFYEREGFRRTGEGLSAASGLPLFTYAWRPQEAG